MSAKVLIAGGGVGALEASLALRDLAGEQVEVAIHSPREDFVYRPFAVTEPYGASHGMRYDLGELADRCGASFRRAAIGSLDTDHRRARTHDGEEVDYDYAIVACGTRLLAGVPGAVTFWGVADDPRVREVVRGLTEGRYRRVAFTMPGGGGTWALPLYELALLAGRELSEKGIEEASIVVVTPEDGPLELFGRRAGAAVADLLAERGIEIVSAASPVKFEEGRLAISPGAAVSADAVLTMPRLEGRALGGVPRDTDGFVPIDGHCRVPGLDRVYAIGDVTAFPVKQGGIAAQQADAAAGAIAAELGCDVEAEPFEPVLRGVLWTGEEPLYLSGYLGGGHGDDSIASEEAPWEGDATGKLVGRYITPFFADLPTGAASGP